MLALLWGVVVCALPISHLPRQSFAEQEVATTDHCSIYADGSWTYLGITPEREIEAQNCRNALRDGSSLLEVEEKALVAWKNCTRRTLDAKISSWDGEILSHLDINHNNGVKGARYVSSKLTIFPRGAAAYSQHADLSSKWVQMVHGDGHPTQGELNHYRDTLKVVNRKETSHGDISSKLSKAEQKASRLLRAHGSGDHRLVQAREEEARLKLEKDAAHTEVKEATSQAWKTGLDTWVALRPSLITALRQYEPGDLGVAGRTTTSLFTVLLYEEMLPEFTARGEGHIARYVNPTDQSNERCPREAKRGAVGSLHIDTVQAAGIVDIIQKICNKVPFTDADVANLPPSAKGIKKDIEQGLLVCGNSLNAWMLVNEVYEASPLTFHIPDGRFRKHIANLDSLKVRSAEQTRNGIKDGIKTGLVVKELEQGDYFLFWTEKTWHTALVDVVKDPTEAQCRTSAEYRFLPVFYKNPCTHADRTVGTCRTQATCDLATHTVHANAVCPGHGHVCCSPLPLKIEEIYPANMLCAAADGTEGKCVGNCVGTVIQGVCRANQVCCQDEQQQFKQLKRSQSNRQRAGSNEKMTPEERYNIEIADNFGADLKVEVDADCPADEMCISGCCGKGKCVESHNLELDAVCVVHCQCKSKRCNAGSCAEQLEAATVCAHPMDCKSQCCVLQTDVLKCVQDSQVKDGDACVDDCQCKSQNCDEAKSKCVEEFADEEE